MCQTCLDEAGRLIARQVSPVRACVLREADFTGHFVLLHECAVEPQLVTNDTATEIGTQVIQMLQRLGIAQTLSPQLVAEAKRYTDNLSAKVEELLADYVATQRETRAQRQAQADATAAAWNAFLDSAGSLADEHSTL